jgi:hypothetical protein
VGPDNPAKYQPISCGAHTDELVAKTYYDPA